MSVRVSPISKTAAILLVAVGVFTLFTGVVADVPINDVAGIAIIALGLALYRLLFRFTKKLETEIKATESD